MKKCTVLFMSCHCFLNILSLLVSWMYPIQWVDSYSLRLQGMLFLDHLRVVISSCTHGIHSLFDSGSDPLWSGCLPPS